MLPADKAQAEQPQAAWMWMSASQEDGIHHWALNIVILYSTEVIENRSDVHTRKRNVLLFSNENIEIHYIPGLDASKRNLLTQPETTIYMNMAFIGLFWSWRALIIFQKKFTQLLIYANSPTLQSGNVTAKTILFNTKLTLCSYIFYVTYTDMFSIL